MAKISNPRKQFQFNISILGLNPFLAQKVRIPDVELEAVEHGDTNYTVKTAGRKIVPTLSVEKISPAESIDMFVWDWIQRIQNTITGGGELPDQYKVDILIEQYSTDGITVIHRWIGEGCWPTKINGIDLDRMGSNNTVEAIDFCLDDIRAI